MMRYLAIVVDDEPYAASNLAHKLDLTGKVQVVEKFDAALDAIDYLDATEQRIHFVFCDIVMEGMRGTDAVRLFRERADCVILYTGKPEYSLDGESHLADAKLPKSVTQAELNETIENLINPRNPKAPVRIPTYINIKAMPTTKEDIDHTDRDIRIAIADLVYVQRKGNYVHVYTLNQQGQIVLTGRLKTSIAALYREYESTNLFLYVNASQLVHVKFIMDHLKDGVTVPGWAFSISAKGMPYYRRYLKRKGLDG
ncbi:response regulator [Sphingobacterium alkalisoli]|uniref:Response regulator n=1 Tax=Sphingobacterium alkalisoli TaxID=1874115 RepID=A0A4U0H3C6_9SPHI|nr:response regulator [Sphingobacterium alkalisoli]TJY66038.1 response regulator [Sphingobacterium alkalisoli]GGH16629.1 DNA-binding response regulator [Sphingobacterium alkalisoli]